jgi:hypothetical protein
MCSGSKFAREKGRQTEAPALYFYQFRAVRIKLEQGFSPEQTHGINNMPWLPRMSTKSAGFPIHTSSMAIIRPVHGGSNQGAYLVVGYFELDAL